MRVLWPVFNLEVESSQYPGIMNISALLKQHDIEVKVVSARLDAVADELKDGAPSILAYSTPTPTYSYYRDLNAQLKAKFPSVLSVFGGPHPTFFPEMIEQKDVDAVCIGEGEYPMLDLVLRAREGRPVNGIENWWVKQDGEICKNPLRPLMEDLDALPPPDHGIFREAMSPDVNQAIVITTRGCPHRCTYCYNHVYQKLYRGKGKIVRRRSVDHVMEELRELKAHSCRFIRFMDDLFILSPEWLAEFAPKYRTEIGLGFSCLVRANFVTHEVVKLMKEAGCYRMLLGVEAGNDRVRNEILKRNMDREVILNAARLIRDAGIHLVTANILAIPGGSIEDDWETLELNVECKPDYASASLLLPFPRTEIYQMAKDMGMLEKEQIADIESSFTFGLRSPLKFEDAREKRLTENLQKFFLLAVKFPWLKPLVRQLIKLPQNRLFDMIYMATVNLSTNLCSIPPSVGFPVLWKKLKGYARPSILWRRGTTREV